MLGQVQLRKQIAIRLKQARKNTGFNSAEDFCRENDLSLEEYPKHEDGSIALRASQAVQYCKLLKVSLHWLMFGEAQIKPKKRGKRRIDKPRKSSVSIKKRRVSRKVSSQH
ncbi:MAG TPA: hypothetical protein VHE99_07610 [Gammaproteobacteria bacterium]|nr:hypothetical protein [Gammaproteobacteria bacterium]